jgi:uroporphyrinogen-III decarboxylase
VLTVLDQPELASLLESLLQVARQASEWLQVWRSFLKEMEGLGFPLFTHSYTLAPFDILSDFLRGMKGTMLDMYRQPDKIITACEKLLPMMIDMGVSTARRTGNPRVFIPLHRGADGFMSLKQFETFYWPTLKSVMMALIDEGLIPCPFFEGSYSLRLEYLKELPRGKVLGHFDRTDIFEAKQIIGDHMCIMGNVPLSLLYAGTPQDVKDYCRRLIDIVGKGGGFIMSAGVSLDDAKVENVIAMFDITQEYGRYR